jgi:type II secretory pathway pseudopilin PulG
MNAPLKQRSIPSEAGLSLLELVIVVAMVGIISGFAIVSFVRASRTVDRTKTAVELANYLKQARVDSMRRNAKDPSQMAQVKVFNRRFYSIAIDGDNDGQLDIPLVMSLPEGPGMEISGPFPKTYIFDWLGQTVDSQNQRVTPPPMVVGNGAGASAIKFEIDGKIVVVPAVKK